MERKIVLDEFYLNAFIRSGIRSGVFKVKDFNEELRTSSRGYSQLSLLVHEAMLLFDNVHFVFDPGVAMNLRFDDFTLLPSFSIGLRLKHFFDSVEGPERLAVDYNDNLFDYASKIADQVESERGLSVGSDAHFDQWGSISFYNEQIQAHLKKSIKERQAPDFLLRTWPLVPRYLKRKFPFARRTQIPTFAFFTHLYLSTPFSEIPKIIRQAVPSVENDTEAIEGMLEVLSLLWYTCRQIEGIIEDAQYRNAIASLAIAGKKNNDTSFETPSRLVTLLISRLDAEGLITPDLSSLRSVLKLREDPRIVDFRQTLWQWTDLVRKGEVQEAEKIATEVRKANRALKRIGTYRKINDWFLYLSLPSIVADALAAVPAFGGILGLAGLGLKVAERKLTKDIEWLLLLHGSGNNR
jgi:hypothetical protein